MTSTRLAAERYLDLLHEEGERLLSAARGRLELPVPACDGWLVDDVVRHVGSVFAHKTAVLRLGRRPEDDEWTGPAADDNALDWCHAALHEIARELGRRDPDEPAWTWWPPEQTVAFWQRRMAHETSIHRVDVESGTGAVTPIEADLAIDGINELLAIHLADAGHFGRASMTIAPGSVRVVIDGVTISGAAPDVLLWLWGRTDDADVLLDGRDALVADVRRLLLTATQ